MAKKKTFKKFSYKKRKFKKKSTKMKKYWTNPKKIKIPGTILPAGMFVKLKYANLENRTTDGAGEYERIYRLNSIANPDLTYGGLHNPYYYD